MGANMYGQSTPSWASGINNFSNFGQIAPSVGGMGPLFDVGSMQDMGSLGGMKSNPLGALGKDSGLGFNIPTAGLALGGLQTLGNIWAAFEANKLAKEQFKYTKSVTDTNMANQLKTYNTGLEDRSRSRAVVEGQSAETAQAYIDKNKLTKVGG